MQNLFLYTTNYSVHYKHVLKAMSSYGEVVNIDLGAWSSTLSLRTFRWMTKPGPEVSADEPDPGRLFGEIFNEH